MIADYESRISVVFCIKHGTKHIHSKVLCRNKIILGTMGMSYFGR